MITRSVLQFKGPVWGMPKSAGGWYGLEFHDVAHGNCDGSIKASAWEGEVAAMMACVLRSPWASALHRAAARTHWPQ